MSYRPAVVLVRIQVRDSLLCVQYFSCAVLPKHVDERMCLFDDERPYFKHMAWIIVLAVSSDGDSGRIFQDHAIPYANGLLCPPADKSQLTERRTGPKASGT